MTVIIQSYSANITAIYNLIRQILRQYKGFANESGGFINYYYCPLNYKKMSPTSYMTEVGLSFCI